MFFNQQKEFELVCMLTASLNVNIHEYSISDLFRNKPEFRISDLCLGNVDLAMQQLREIERQFDEKEIIDRMPKQKHMDEEDLNPYDLERNFRIEAERIIQDVTMNRKG